MRFDYVVYENSQPYLKLKNPKIVVLTIQKIVVWIFRTCFL